MDKTGQSGTVERCLVMMAKFPEPGQVKTRLAAEIGEHHAAELCRRFILDLLQRLPSPVWSFRLALYPGERKAEMAGIIGEDVVQIPQRGNDLGERMGNIFADAFAGGYREAVIVGNDAPDLPPDFVDEAFTALADHDAVLGPACDGGYYLIGFRRESFRDRVLDCLPWSTPELFPQQMRRFQEQGLRSYILPPWQDIDTLADLKNTVSLAAATPFAESRTMAYIRSSGLIRV